MRGFWHTVEAVMAGIIIILFLAAIFSRQVAVAPGPNAMIMQGFEELRDLEKKGLLRDYVAALDSAGLNSEIQMSFNHSISICGTGGACTGSAPSAENVWIATYFVAGKHNYTPYEVILYLW